jgi:hypothetical protein
MILYYARPTIQIGITRDELSFLEEPLEPCANFIPLDDSLRREDAVG